MTFVDFSLWADHLILTAQRAPKVDASSLAPCRAFAAWRGLADAGALPNAPAGVDDRLWGALALDEASIAVDAIVTSSAEGAMAPLVTFDESVALEVWTERELSGVHALHRAARRVGSDEGVKRALECARWHVINTQPDNATNRPWGICVFLALAVRDENAEARLYAETLLHNCQALAGAPDALSGEILRDSAEALQEEASGARSP